MYTEQEIDEYNEYMDWVREQIIEDEDRHDPRFSYKLIDIDQVALEKTDHGTCYRHEWSITYSDGEVVVGTTRTPSFDDWASIKKAKKSAERLDELLP